SNPHSLLDKNTMKVNIGRAKRISTRSYQHLAHHSEDWEKMSILSPKPRKILHEELIIDFTVYENMLLKAFLHEAIKHLNKRIKETADISKFFLSIFGTKWVCLNCNHVHEGVEKPDVCPNCKNENANWIEEINTIWAEKIDRRNALVGRAIKSDKTKDTGITNRVLVSLKSELVKLEHSPLFEEFPKHSMESVVYHDTNVLNSHKHYKYLKILWLELKKLKEQAGEEDSFIVHQEIMNNMRTYVESLFLYSLRYMDYKITRVENIILAKHESLPTIRLSIDKYGVLHISTDDVIFNIITLGGIYEKENILRLPQGTYCFCFSDYQKPKNNVEGIYFVNPIDTNSIEYSGQVIRMLIIQEYIAILNKKNPFKHSLRDFVSLIGCKDIIFDKTSFTYSFGKELPNKIEENDVTSIVKESQEFKQRNKREQEALLSDMSGLIHEINEKCSAISKTIVCPKCSKQCRSRDLRYLVCDCGFICDLSSPKGKLFHSQKDSSYSNITQKGWGMDYIE
ncbi:MAG: hypothetical protein SPF70_00820, partial [Lachnospiraceae bacterium]|nr:hypothetical protein [Lachnospiraceae bacterium]